MRSAPRLYYGWIIAAACFAITLTLGEAFYAFGVFVKPLEREFGWSRAVTTSAYTAMLLGYAPASYLSGRLADRYGPKVVVSIGGALTGAGFLLASRVGSVLQFQIMMALVGLGAGATWVVPAATVQRWFVRRRGMMLGVMGAGVGLGATIFVPLTNWFVASYSWRTAFVLVGGLYMAIILLAASLLVHSPERKGLLPYGASNPVISGAIPVSAGFTARQAMATRAFLLLLLAVIIAQVPTQVMIVHFVPFAIEVGIPAAVAATAMGLMGGFSLPGRLAGGAVADRIGFGRALALANIGMGVMVLALLWITTSVPLFLFVFLFSLFHGARNPAQWGIFGHYFGTRSLGEILGLVQGISTVVGAVGPLLAGAIFDATGSYDAAFLLVSGLFVGGGVLVFLTRPSESSPHSSDSFDP